MRAPAPAKINLALVVGPAREDGKHEVATVLQRVDLARPRRDRAGRRASPSTGFAADTLVRDALVALAAAAGVEPRWRATIAKRIPVAAGLGGGSSDAATALRLANETLARAAAAPTSCTRSPRRSAPTSRSSWPTDPQLGRGDGSELEPLDLPQDYWIVLALPHGATKESTAAVYGSFDERAGADGWEQRSAAAAEPRSPPSRGPRDLAALPPNDLASSPLAAELRRLGAFRADVSGAGPTVYGLFHHRRHADAARQALRSAARTWLTVPVWYG